MVKTEARTWSAAEGFAYCERLARSHYENFPVGSLLVPKNRRPHFYSIYAFARTADDFADETDVSLDGQCHPAAEARHKRVRH